MSLLSQLSFTYMVFMFMLNDTYMWHLNMIIIMFLSYHYIFKICIVLIDYVLWSLSCLYDLHLFMTTQFLYLWLHNSYLAFMVVIIFWFTIGGKSEQFYLTLIMHAFTIKSHIVTCLSYATIFYHVYVTYSWLYLFLLFSNSFICNQLVRVYMVLASHLLFLCLGELHQPYPLEVLLHFCFVKALLLSISSGISYPPFYS